MPKGARASVSAKTEARQEIVKICLWRKREAAKMAASLVVADQLNVVLFRAELQARKDLFFELGRVEHAAVRP